MDLSHFIHDETWQTVVVEKFAHGVVKNVPYESLHSSLNIESTLGGDDDNLVNLKCRPSL